MYGRVVILLDGSKLAERAVPHAAEIIRSYDSSVSLLSVVPLASSRASYVSAGVRGVPSPADVQRERLRIERSLRAYLDGLACRLDDVAREVEVAVRVGRPADAILDFVRQKNADLVIVSSHGRSGIGGWVFGSVADRVLRGTSCPVLLVRGGTEAERATYRHILVPLDGSPLAEQVLPHVRSLVRPDETKIHLVSVVTSGFGDRALSLMTSSPPGLQIATAALDRLEAHFQSYLRAVAAGLRVERAKVQTAVRRGSPAREILSYAADADVDLVAMTTHGLSGLSRWVFGSVADKVLQGSVCPVLLVRSVPDNTEAGR
jgi:nucleotide-binding universal stress UspA family protein